MIFINLTPHMINVVGGIQFPASGTVARVTAVSQAVEEVKHDGKVVLLTKTIFGKVENLPEPIEGTRYIVSTMVAQAAEGRHDLLTPGELVRDDQGNVIGCKSLNVWYR